MACAAIAGLVAKSEPGTDLGTNRRTPQCAWSVQSVRWWIEQQRAPLRRQSFDIQKQWRVRVIANNVPGNSLTSNDGKNSTLRLARSKSNHATAPGRTPHGPGKLHRTRYNLNGRFTEHATCGAGQGAKLSGRQCTVAMTTGRHIFSQ